MTLGKIHTPWEDLQPLGRSTTLVGKIHGPWGDPQQFGRCTILRWRFPAIGKVENPWGISVHQPRACCRGMSCVPSCTTTVQGASVVPGVSSPSTTSPSTTSKPSLNTPRDGDTTTSLSPHPYTRPPYLRRRCVGSPRGSTHLRIPLPMRFFLTPGLWDPRAVELQRTSWLPHAVFPWGPALSPARKPRKASGEAKPLGNGAGRMKPRRFPRRAGSTQLSPPPLSRNLV